MFIGKFLVLEGVYTYLNINYFSQPVSRQIQSSIQEHFDTYMHYDYGYILEYIGEGVYGITNGDVFIAFDEDRIIDIAELYSIAFNDRNNSNSVH